MHKTLQQILFFTLMLVQLTSCITTSKTNYLQDAKIYIPTYDSLAYEEYLLKPGDRLYMIVYSTDSKTNALFNGSSSSGMQMLSGSGTGENLDLYTYIIQQNGSIQFPIVGEIAVSGKSIRETKSIIEESIRPILKINSVDVRMVSRSFSIIGAGKSGRFAFPKEKVNIYQALAMAGDLGFYTDRSKVKILRESGNGTQIKTFDIRSIDIINSEFYYLEPNDVIFLQPLKEQFFGVTSFWVAMSTLVTTYSFGLIVYKSLK